MCRTFFRDIWLRWSRWRPQLIKCWIRVPQVLSRIRGCWSSGECHEQGIDRSGCYRGNCIAGLPVFLWAVRKREEHAGEQERGCEGSVVASRHRAAAPLRPDPKFGGDGEGLCAARGYGVWRHRESPLCAAFSWYAAGEDC